jgi:hypothetical protein
MADSGIILIAAGTELVVDRRLQAGQKIENLHFSG